jgi:hypothetical protein
MSEIEKAEQHLKAARVQESKALATAVLALREAVRAKKLGLYAWIALAEARGSTDDFKKTYEETAYLQFLEDQGCEKIVRKALQTGFFSRAWFLMP